MNTKQLGTLILAIFAAVYNIVLAVLGNVPPTESITIAINILNAVQPYINTIVVSILAILGYQTENKNKALEAKA
jgi:hypothetical protein